MKPTLTKTLSAALSRLVNRGTALLAEPPQRERYGQPSGMIKVRLAQSAALAEAARRSLHGSGGAP
jgi:hypothetical protein